MNPVKKIVNKVHIDTLYSTFIHQDIFVPLKYR